MLPFSFQKGNKAAGCEDAPPVAEVYYSVVCDGLGGAGSMKHKVSENGVPAMRTSGYLGSRVVCKSVKEFYVDNYARMSNATLQRMECPEGLPLIIGELKNKIKEDLMNQMSALDIDPMLTRNKTLKIFPTTLASLLYFQNGKKITILAIWAGDSRAYVLSPTKGLQLLSLDDAVNADTEMKSASEMTNCISAGNPFKLNYSIFELEEPGIVFCCSDGCFDYLPSPLHFEWLLLQTILSYVPDADKNELGQAFAFSVRDSVYQSIGDDTTMAGIICNIDSTKQLKDIFADRMEQFGQLALQMNNALKEQRYFQNEKDSASKKCRLFESKVLAELQTVITDALLEKSPAMLYSFLGTLPCFADYQRIIDEINKQVDEECVAELQGLNDQLNELKNVCIEMIVRDFMKWRRENAEQPVVASPVMDFLSPKIREVGKRNLRYPKPTSLIQPLNACAKLFNHPDFKRIGLQISMPDAEFAEYIRSLISQIEALIAILDNDSRLFEDMWSQAYFSTDRFDQERQEIKRSRDFSEIVEEALRDPISCRYLSELTRQKINEYKNMSNNMFSIQQKYMAERESRLKSVPAQFYSQNENEIVECIFRQSTVMLTKMFAGTGISVERLVSFVEAKNAITGIDQKVSSAQQKVSEIWNIYRPNYQLFSVMTEKGIV